MAEIGRRNSVSIERCSAPGLYLNCGELGEILLPGKYAPDKLTPGMKLDVFIYLDSEDRLVATTETPRVMAGEFAYLKVVSVNERVGAFLDWGLQKDLLLPFREQEKPVREGQWVVIYCLLDPKSKRLVATTRLYRHYKDGAIPYREGQMVNLLISGIVPLGYNAIIENSYKGLLYADKLSAPLKIGQRLSGYIRGIRSGGKIDLSLDAAGYQRVKPLTEQILEALERNGGKLEFDDDSTPESIRESFGCSKKAFKQALGALYKARRIVFSNPGIETANSQSGVEATKSLP